MVRGLLRRIPTPLRGLAAGLLVVYVSAVLRALAAGADLVTEAGGGGEHSLLTVLAGLALDVLVIEPFRAIAAWGSLHDVGVQAWSPIGYGAVRPDPLFGVVDWGLGPAVLVTVVATGVLAARWTGGPPLVRAVGGTLAGTVLYAVAATLLALGTAWVFDAVVVPGLLASGVEFPIAFWQWEDAPGPIIRYEAPGGVLQHLIVFTAPYVTLGALLEAARAGLLADRSTVARVGARAVGNGVED